MRLVILFSLISFYCQGQITAQGPMVYAPEQFPTVVQRASTTGTNTATLVFTETPKSGSLLLFFFASTSGQADLTASPTGYANVNAPTSDGTAPMFHVGRVIADGSTNSFTFTVTTGANINLYGFEIINWSTVTVLGNNFAAGATFIDCSSVGISWTYRDLGFGFMNAANTFSNLAVDDNFIINLSTTRSGTSERTFTGSSSDIPRYTWTTSRQARGVVIKVKY